MKKWVDERAGERLLWEDWGSLLKHATRHARKRIGCRHWRGDRDGVLPEGQDAEGVAAAAAAAMLGGKCRMVLGWTRERVEKVLEQHVEREVHRLNSLKEAAVTRSEWDILPTEEDEEPQTVFEEKSGAQADGCEEMALAEEVAVRAQAKKEIDRFLAGDELARGVFQCLCDEVTKREDMATRLAVTVSEVSAARKRLERRLAEFATAHPEYAEAFCS
jgi:hypothetical protein